MMTEKRVKAHCSEIEWDLEPGDEEASKKLPRELDIWISAEDAAGDDDSVSELLTDLVSTQEGFCVKSLSYELGEPEEVELNE